MTKDNQLNEKKEFMAEGLEKVSGGDGTSIGGDDTSLGGNSNTVPPGNTSQPEAFGVIKCPQCGEEDKLEYLNHTSEGYHFRCKKCQTEFVK